MYKLTLWNCVFMNIDKDGNIVNFEISANMKNENLSHNFILHLSVVESRLISLFLELFIY